MNSLSGYFEGIVAKRLSAVEVDKDRSHQHEFNAPAELIKLLGKMEPGDKQPIPTAFLYLADDEEDVERCTSELTYYESRKAPRSEHRVYYNADSSAVTELFKEGDLLIFARKKDQSMMLIAARRGSAVERQILWLFSLSPETFETIEYKDLQDAPKELNFAEKLILEELGIEAIESDESGLDEMLKKFGGIFPATHVFSEFARSKIGSSDLSYPDAALILWITKEEALFRALEKHLVAKTLREGFGSKGDDVDAFIQFSLSVHNRRKARMGKALENHLHFLFTEMKIRFAHGEATEGKKKPDFVFPGIAEYHDAAFATDKLTMLGAKSTCKDRWRQVMSEAERIKLKHLITLEPGITQDQTQEMVSANLQLVVPAGLHQSYSDKQREWLWDLKTFTDFVIKKQK